MLLPQEVKVLKQVQERFDLTCILVRNEAEGIVQSRAHRDTQTPVWHRIPWPVGFVYEIGKRVERIKGPIPDLMVREDKKEVILTSLWIKVREEALDLINYLVFFVAFGDMCSGYAEEGIGE